MGRKVLRRFADCGVRVPEVNRTIRWMSGLVLLVAACGQKASNPPVTLQLEVTCSPAQAECSARAGAARLTLALSDPLPLKPFVVLAGWDGPAAESVTVSFEMIGMDMGENRYRMMPEGNKRWRGTAVLPVCTAGRSDWVAEVVVQAAGVRHVGRFPFQTGR